MRSLNLIPHNELLFTFARSGGAGGQNVNKTSTKATIHWSVRKSAVFTPEQKAIIRARLQTRLTAEDEIVVVSERERSQLQNRAVAEARLQELVAAALQPIKPRHATRPTYASKVRHLESKTKRSSVKQNRRRLTRSENT